jgi:hypothetical protein
MGGDGIVALELTDKQRRFLRSTLGNCQVGREDDLRTHPDHSRARRWRADAAAYGRLIVGLDAGEIVPDDRARRLVCELAEASDREEEYERVVFEHDALAVLCAQIGAGR